MLERKKYSNGQSIYELTDERLTFYYKNGKIKAEGWFKNNLMEGQWIFYRESGQLWQVGNFSKGVKHGSWFASTEMTRHNTARISIPTSLSGQRRNERR